jgi:hypothetical protein
MEGVGRATGTAGGVDGTGDRAGGGSGRGFGDITSEKILEINYSNVHFRDGKFHFCAAAWALAWLNPHFLARKCSIFLWRFN